MKNLKFVLFFLICKNTFGQFALEHTYPGTSYFISSTNLQQLYMVKLEIDGEKYVHVDRTNKALNFYNLDHTSFKTISFSSATDLNTNANIQGFLYITQNLFDNDNEIEFLYCDQNNPNYVTQIINEDGAILFTANNEYPAVYVNAPQQQLPIYNTSVGTKLILSAANGDGKVYSLPGTLTSMAVINIEDSRNNISIFPNPSSKKITIDDNEAKIKTAKIIDINGKLIQTINFNNDDKKEINITNLSNGIYFIQSIDKNGITLENKKIVKE